MISINGESDVYVLDLNESEDDSFSLDILSELNGRHCHWWVDLISDSNNIYAESYLSSKLSIEANLEGIKKEEFIILRNSYRESLKILIKPNFEAIREKEYVFKVGKTTISGKTVSVSIISKESGNNIPWEITYDGRPISYDIVKLKTKITLTLKSEIYSKASSVIELTQDKSNKKIVFKLTHKDSDSVEIKTD